MIKQLSALIIFIIFVTVGLHIYLQPNDLSSCEEAPVLTESAGKCQPADAVVAISGGDTNARTDKAISLYKNGWAKKIIFSGAAADKLIN